MLELQRRCMYISTYLLNGDPYLFPSQPEFLGNMNFLVTPTYFLAGQNFGKILFIDNPYLFSRQPIEKINMNLPSDHFKIIENQNMHIAT